MDKPVRVDEEAFVNKLILLYIFDQCNVGLIENVIYDIATSHNWIQPMFCKPAFDDLSRRITWSICRVRARPSRVTR